MINGLYWIFCLPILTMVLVVLIPAQLANRRVRSFASLVTGLAALNGIAALSALTAILLFGPAYFSVLSADSASPLNLSVYLDGASCLMLTLVGSIGWVICRYSIRYLDGEPQQGRYFRWTAFTIGAVSLAVVAGNLALMLLALLLTSIGLHQLLVHYEDRETAHRAANLKFVFSRLGDLSLLAALVLLYREFGTLELPHLFAAANALGAVDITASGTLPVVGWLLALCAVFKSAQFPFHSWLPETMEAPTPVSALMHAGIVNAGGYLLIRLAPIVSLAPAAMWAVAGLGALTAIVAALVMLTQTSVKRSLAWSTIAQMGFMMLQCGLGAFSAAMLHIIAHSLYKAHAFLASGSVMTERLATATATPSERNRAATAGLFAVSAAISLLLFAGLSAAGGVSIEEKPGGYLLGLLLCLAVTRWLWRMLANGPAFAFSGVAISAVMIGAYLTGFVAVDSAMAGSAALPRPVVFSGLLTALVAASFLLLFLVDTRVLRPHAAGWVRSLYVHSSNGFYIDVLWRHMAKSVTS